MVKNITLTAEEKLIEAARARAQQQRTTLNEAFRQWLLRYVAADAASGQFRQLMRQLKHVNAGRKFSRDDLNER